MPTTQLPLKDIHLPDAISWWPPAIGWWLIIILMPLLIVFFYWFYKRLTRKTAINTAIKRLVVISGCGQLLADAPYKNTQPTDLEITQLSSLCENWLKVQTKFTKRKLKS
jgi:hypothetical protein